MIKSYSLKQFVGTLFFFLVLFVSAGKLIYYQGLVYTAIGLIMYILSNTALKPGSELLIERSEPGKNSKRWDMGFLGLSFIFALSMYIVAGLDSGRFNWSPKLHWSLCFTGCIMTISGQLLFLIAQKQNKFFSSTVRIQTDRNHTVCETGLYGIVRHPAYLGSIIQALGFPLLLGSLWSVIPVCLLTITSLIRTYLEDETLKNELDGYLEYSDRIRYRIIPYIW